MSTAPNMNHKTISVSHAEAADADRISHLHGQLFDQGWGTSFIADLIANPACKVLVALAAGDHQTGRLGIRGFIIVRCAADQAEVLSIGVGASNQRCGVGEWLLRAALNEVAQSEVKSVFLDVAADNMPARRLYERFGFQQIDVRKRYYSRVDGAPCDGLVLSVALTPLRS